MTNWEKGAKIEGENLEHLPDDHIVWIEWNDGLSGPMMMEDFRQQGGTGGEVYNLSVQTASLEAVMDDHMAKWDAKTQKEKDRWKSIFE